MIDIRFWKSKKVKTAESIEKEFFMRQKRFQLKNRAMNAIKYETNWELRLMNFMEKNENNQNLLIKIVGYRSYLLRNGADEEEAAKECLEMYQH